MMILPNQRHEKFAQRVASGESATAAYRLVYAKAKNADVMGPRLLGNVGVRNRVAELQAQSATAATLTMKQRREIACTIALDTTAKASDRLAAIMADARLAGELVEKVDMAMDDKRVLPPDQRAELLRRSIERRAVTHGQS